MCTTLQKNPASALVVAGAQYKISLTGRYSLSLFQSNTEAAVYLSKVQETDNGIQLVI